jgi:hypothetical protein
MSTRPGEHDAGRACANLDDMTVNLDASIRAATDTARRDATQ